ncbi:MAG: DegT/DnrJ/EryC1/StrS family aminotransferase, partial [Burkholderiales bacterium]
MIFVTKTFLPIRRSFDKYVDRIYENNWVTNFGPLERELTEKLKEFLEVEHLLLVSNGTLALQIAYRALDLKGEVITTPFSFAATTSSLVWENLTPKFVDIDIDTFNLNAQLIATKITPDTTGILPVHVFGRACDVWEIQKIADQHKVKVIYDAAHAFNVRTQEGKSLLNYGDASTLSFHATKLFHTIEGGAIVAKDEGIIKKCKELINFGITGYDCINGIGINSKMNEFSAAMGLAVLEHISDIMAERERVSITYGELLNPELIPSVIDYASANYSYYPILLKDEFTLLAVRDALLANEIMPRRYFYPSLNTLNYVKYQACPISEGIASRILCLPM